MNIELRWLVPAHNATSFPKLQLRQFTFRSDTPANALGIGMEWTEWKDVPTVVDSQIEGIPLAKPAP